MTALLVVLLGAGVTALGVLWSDAYDIGVVVIAVGLVGLAVAAGDAARWWYGRHRPG